MLRGQASKNDRDTLHSESSAACGDGALWEIWAVGASHAGGSSSSGHSAAAVPVGDDGRGISVFCLFPPGSGGNQRDHPELSLGLLESPFSMFHNMGLCSRPEGGAQCLETHTRRAVTTMTVTRTRRPAPPGLRPHRP